MMQEKRIIGGIPAIIWGQPSDKVFIHVHGKMSRKEYAESFAVLAEQEGCQTLSFDLPEHGERIGTTDRCDVWTGQRDLTAIADEAFARWQHVSLFACSLGAYFSLQTYAERPFEQCLFQSPVVDMRWLVTQMMRWSDVNEDMLHAQQEIATPIDTLRWDYYQYILRHPTVHWPIPTQILYGALDNLQPRESVEAFADRFGCRLTVSPTSQHPFMEPQDAAIVADWTRSALQQSK